MTLRRVIGEYGRLPAVGSPIEFITEAIGEAESTDPDALRVILRHCCEAEPGQAPADFERRATEIGKKVMAILDAHALRNFHDVWHHEEPGDDGPLVAGADFGNEEHWDADRRDRARDMQLTASGRP